MCVSQGEWFEVNLQVNLNTNEAPRPRFDPGFSLEIVVFSVFQAQISVFWFTRYFANSKDKHIQLTIKIKTSERGVFSIINSFWILFSVREATVCSDEEV